MAETILGMAALQRRIAAITPGKALGKDIMNTLADHTVREAKLLEAPHRKTGNLGRTIHKAEVTSESARIVASANYARYLEEGTRAHDITPNAKKALAWAAGSAGGAFRRLSGAARKGVSAGSMTFAMRVHHPGTKAYPFMKPGAEKAITSAGLAERIVSAWDRAA